MSQPHIHEAGAFDPAIAFGQTVHALIHLVEGASEEPDALPPEEILRAAQTAVDTMVLVQEMTTQSLMARLSTILPEEVVRDHLLTAQAQQELRSESEREEYKMKILRRIATIFPHEDAMSDHTDD